MEEEPEEAKLLGSTDRGLARAAAEKRETMVSAMDMTDGQRFR